MRAFQLSWIRETISQIAQSKCGLKFWKIFRNHTIWLSININWFGLFNSTFYFSNENKQFSSSNHYHIHISIDSIQYNNQFNEFSIYYYYFFFFFFSKCQSIFLSGIATTMLKWYEKRRTEIEKEKITKNEKWTAIIDLILSYFCIHC